MKIKHFLLLALAAIAIFSLPSFKGERSDVEYDESGNVVFQADANLPVKVWPVDVIVNALKDTLAVPFSLVSRYSYSVHATLATNSGTRAMKIYLDESNTTATGAADWFAVDSITPTAAVNQYLMEGTNVYGRRQRIRVSGNTGATQNVSYTISALYKVEK